MTPAAGPARGPTAGRVPCVDSDRAGELLGRRAPARAARTHGRSVQSSEPIPDERLEAVPTAEEQAAARD
jgi:RNA polymerase-binding transcription factor DksA